MLGQNNPDSIHVQIGQAKKKNGAGQDAIHLYSQCSGTQAERSQVQSQQGLHSEFVTSLSCVTSQPVTKEKQNPKLPTPSECASPALLPPHGSLAQEIATLFPHFLREKAQVAQRQPGMLQPLRCLLCTRGSCAPCALSWFAHIQILHG